MGAVPFKGKTFWSYGCSIRESSVLMDQWRISSQFGVSCIPNCDAYGGKIRYCEMRASESVCRMIRAIHSSMGLTL